MPTNDRDEAMRVARLVVRDIDRQRARGVLHDYPVVQTHAERLARALIEAVESLERWQAGLVTDLAIGMIAIERDSLRADLAAAQAERDEARAEIARLERRIWPNGER